MITKRETDNKQSLPLLDPSKVNLYMLNFYHSFLSLSLLGGHTGLRGRVNGRHFLPESLLKKVNIHSISQESEMVHVKCITCVQNITRRDIVAMTNFRVSCYFGVNHY